MKESMIDFFKKALLFVIVFAFLCFNVEAISSTCGEIATGLSKYDLYRSSDILTIQFMLIIMAFVMLTFAIFTYFKILVGYVLTERIEKEHVSKEEENQYRYIKRLNTRFAAIVTYSIFARLLSVVASYVTLFLRY